MFVGRSNDMLKHKGEYIRFITLEDMYDSDFLIKN